MTALFLAAALTGDAPKTFPLPPVLLEPSASVQAADAEYVEACQREKGTVVALFVLNRTRAVHGGTTAWKAAKERLTLKNNAAVGMKTHTLERYNDAVAALQRAIDAHMKGKP